MADLEHIGITVKNIEAIIESHKRFGFKEARAITDKPDLRLRLAMVQLGELKIEFIEPYENPLDTPLHKVGAYHLAIYVDDREKIYNELRGEYCFIEELIALGVYFYALPDGILIELRQRK